MFVWPNISGGKSQSIIPVTIGEAASLEKTTIEYLCLAAVYQLLEEGKLSITDVQAAYQRGETST